MSMNHEIRIKNLEERLEAAEKILDLILCRVKVTGLDDPHEYRIQQTWRGRFDVYQGDVKVNDVPLLKAEAESMRDELSA